uniref:Uncharacterized protein n=1 Tax=Corvus moneduloides TaxID=1196302 RepID=A0A8C3EH70_CORMO
MALLPCQRLLPGFCKTACEGGVGWVWAVRGVLPILAQRDAAWDMWGRAGLVGLETSTVALPAGRWLPVCPCTRSSLPAAAGLANIIALGALPLPI